MDVSPSLSCGDLNTSLSASVSNESKAVSLTEDIRNKVDSIREAKRLDHEKYLNFLKEDIRLKTLNAAKSYNRYEQSIRDYQTLIECRLENTLTSSFSKQNDSTYSSLETPSLIGSVNNLATLSNENQSLDFSSDRCFESSIASNTTADNSICQSNTIKESLSYHDKLHKAKVLCLEMKKDYDFLESSLRRANIHIATVRESYHRNLLSYNQLEKDLIKVSSSFESKAKAELEFHLKSLNSEISEPSKKKKFLYNYQEEIINQEFEFPTRNLVKKRKAEDMSTCSEALLDPPSISDDSSLSKNAEGFKTRKLSKESTIPAFMFIAVAGGLIASLIPGYL